jgi:hypothetical protein
MKDLLSHVRGSSVFVQPVFRFSFVRATLCTIRDVRIFHGSSRSVDEAANLYG